MLRSFGIRSKILAVLALPVLVLALAASVIATTAVRDATKARQIEALTDQAGGLVDLVRGLGTERALTVASLAGNEEAGAQLVAVRAAIDEAMAKVDQNNTELDLSSLDEASRAGYAAAAAANDTLPGLRRQVDGDILTPETALLRYTEVINADIAVPAAIADGVDDRQLAAQLRAYSANLELMDAISIERDISTPAIAAGGYDEATHEAAVDAARRTDLIRERTTSLSLAAQVRTPATGYTMQLARQRTIDDADRVLENVTVDYWVGAFDEDIDALGTGFTALIDGAKERAQSLADGADRRSIEVIVLALLAVLVPVALALWLARRITRPLRRLTEAAGQIRRDLPKMVEQMATPGEGPDISIPEIPVQSNDEVGRLARAFNEVNSTTVATAQEQAALRGSIAAMFVNVARRDQVLLSRQLAFLDQLERTEENPDTLDNLFKLDHLATRMRRNAESLLVLAGIDTGRRLRRPMPLADVVRTASSEIEHYERVDLAQHVDPPMVGHAALIAAHLLAELLENSTAFSDPGSRVLVSTEAGPIGVRVTITDEGLGMSPEELAEFNDRIQNPPVSEVVGAQRLGFYVVGRLANRLEAVVTLAAGRDERGTVVTVDLPAALFTPGSIEGPDTATGSDAGAKDEVSAPDSIAPVSADALAHAAEAVAAAAAAVAADTLQPRIIGSDDLPKRGGGDLPKRGGDLPTRSPAPAAETAPELPSRTPAAPVPAPDPVVPAQRRDPSEARPGLFTGFRARRAEAVGRSVVPETAGEDEPSAEVAQLDDTALTAPVVAEVPFVAELEPEPVAVVEPEPVPVLEPEPVVEAVVEPEPEPEPVAAPAPVEQPVSRRSASSELTALAAAQPAPAAAPAEPAAAPAPVFSSATAMDILPGAGGRGRGLKRRGRGAVPEAEGQPNRITYPTMTVADLAATAESDVPEAYTPVMAATSTPLPSAAAPAPAPAGEPVAEVTPTQAVQGAGDVLRQRSAMASIALSELSALSSYRPEGGSAPAAAAAAPLARRTRGATAAAEVTQTSAAVPNRPGRTAADVRSMLSGFQAGVQRGRATDSAPANAGAGEEGGR